MRVAVRNTQRQVLLNDNLHIQILILREIGNPEAPLPQRANDTVLPQPRIRQQLLRLRLRLLLLLLLLLSLLLCRCRLLRGGGICHDFSPL